jgi:hypothetical protein
MTSLRHDGRADDTSTGGKAVSVELNPLNSTVA